MALPEAATPVIVAFMDIGTNSIRLSVVRVNANHSFAVIQQLKETVRLGEAEFAHNRLHPESIERAVAIIRQFALLSRSLGAEEIIAVATAATREAENRRVFLDRVQEETGIEVHVVSGLEEARLIYLGVTSGVSLEGRNALCIDIGGGSTEISIGNQTQHEYLNSLKLGAIRLTNRFLSGHDGPVSAKLYQRICRLVRNESARALTELRAYKFELVLGSSGTIENLAEIACRLQRGRSLQREESVTYNEIKQTISFLCSLSVEQRRNVPGMNPTRADIIIGGAAILDTLMEDLGVASIRISERGLREGLLQDYLRKNGHTELVEGRSVRERSVLQLGRNCHFDEAHAYQTARLAVELFDATKRIGLHRLGDAERELLRYAALGHHIGTFLTYNNYQRHSAYMISNADLLGFDQTEVAMMALTVLHHRNAVPRKREPALAELTPAHADAVRDMAMMLRLAESLDRSQASIVSTISMTRLSAKRIVLQVAAEHGWEVERTSLEGHAKAFEKAFDVSLVIEAVPHALVEPVDTLQAVG